MDSLCNGKNGYYIIKSSVAWCNPIKYNRYNNRLLDKEALAWAVI